MGWVEGMGDELTIPNLSPDDSRIRTDLACLLIPQEIFPQSSVIIDTAFPREFPCETNILRDLGTNS